MSYIIDTNTDSSKIIHLNTADADTYLQSGVTTYCSFNLDTPIVIDKQHSALISLNSAIIPYSMYNIRENVNDKIIALLKERLELGAKKYGHENIISDNRDFTQEALEEVLDCMVYAACKLLELKERK